MERIIKACYVLLVAMVVFVGGLLICSGLSQTPRTAITQYHEGSAL